MTHALQIGVMLCACVVAIMGNLPETVFLSALMVAMAINRRGAP